MTKETPENMVLTVMTTMSRMKIGPKNVNDFVTFNKNYRARDINERDFFVSLQNDSNLLGACKPIREHYLLT